MTEFIRQDLRGARFSEVYLQGASFEEVSFADAQFREVTFQGARIRGSLLEGANFSGDFETLVINGVDVGPLINAELNRRDPEREIIYATSAESFRSGWAIMERRWAETIERARQLPEDWLHESVDDEWSFIQTLRHVSFVSAAWIERALLEHPSPWHELDLPWDSAPEIPGLDVDRDARPGLDEVVALLRRRGAVVRDYLAVVTERDLDARVSPPRPGWPDIQDHPVRDCILVTMSETYEHHQFAQRDLALVIARHQED